MGRWSQEVGGVMWIGDRVHFISCLLSCQECVLNGRIEACGYLEVSL